MLTRKAITRVCEHQGKYLSKSCGSFSNGVLPTKRDVLKRLLYERNCRTRAAAVIVAKELYECWIHCNVYCISVDDMVFKILTLVKDFQQIESQPKKEKKGFNTSATFNYNMTEFLHDIEELFDIFCNDQKQRQKLKEINKLKMNKDDFAFYEDQIDLRKRKCLDVVEAINQSDINFLQKMSQKQANSNNTVSTSSANIDIVLRFASDTSTSENSEKSVLFDSVLTCSSKSILQQNRVILKELAMVCEQYEVSDRAGVAIALATLKAFGIVTEEDKRYVVDRSKLQRERQKCKDKIKNKEQELFELVDSIFVDGRKDATMTMVEVNDNYHCQTVIEKHYIIVGEPNSFYLSHVMRDDGTGYKIATSAYSVIKDTALE